MYNPRTINEIIEFTQEELDVQIQKHPFKKTYQQVGFVIDEKEKQLYLKLYEDARDSIDEYEWADIFFLKTDLVIDFKSTHSKTFTISENEYFHGFKMLKEGLSMIYRLYEQNIDDMNYKYLGEISLDTLDEHSLIQISKFESGYYFWKDKAEPFLK